MMLNSDKTAQKLLDAIHATEVFIISWDNSTKKARTDQIRLMRERIRYVKRALRQNQDEIKKRYDGRVAGQAERERQELRPLAVIDDLIASIELYLREVEAGNIFSLSSDGDVIYGTYEDNYWAIGSEKDALLHQIDRTVNTLRFANEELKDMILDAQKKYKSKRYIVVGVINAFFVIMFSSLAIVLYFAPQPRNMTVLSFLSAILAVLLIALYFNQYILGRRRLKKFIIEMRTLYQKNKKSLIFLLEERKKALEIP